MEKYADYRTYLKFSMYEQTEDKDGNVKKNYVDDMAGRDSGGEGQNPKYVALLAGFAMLYHQQTNRDTKIRLVLLDEAKYALHMRANWDSNLSSVCRMRDYSHLYRTWTACTHSEEPTIGFR